MHVCMYLNLLTWTHDHASAYVLLLTWTHDHVKLQFDNPDLSITNYIHTHTGYTHGHAMQVLLRP